MPATPRQCATNAITAVLAASTIFAMGAMLGRPVHQLKMPWPDAYRDSNVWWEDKPELASSWAVLALENVMK